MYTVIDVFMHSYMYICLCIYKSTCDKVIIDDSFRVRLVEFAAFPADVHELRKSFDSDPWTKSFAEELSHLYVDICIRCLC